MAGYAELSIALWDGMSRGHLALLDEAAAIGVALASSADDAGMVAGAEDPGVQRVLGRAFAFADQELAGIEEAAKELAAVAQGDVALMETAIRRVHAEAQKGSDRRSKQVASLLRRALEIGEWDWERYEQGRR